MSVKQSIRIGAIGLLSILMLWIGAVLSRLAIVSRRVPQPQAILVLGGGQYREAAAAKIASYYPTMDVWISSGTKPDDVRQTFHSGGIAEDRLHLDYQATDTVTNFTTLVSAFKAHDVQHIYLVTSDFHMPRAKAIANIVLGSKGIVFTPVTIADEPTEEPNSKLVRDVGRSLLWLVTGRTGASLRLLWPERFR